MTRALYRFENPDKNDETYKQFLLSDTKMLHIKSLRKLLNNREWIEWFYEL